MGLYAIVYICDCIAFNITISIRIDDPSGAAESDGWPFMIVFFDQFLLSVVMLYVVRIVLRSFVSLWCACSCAQMYIYALDSGYLDYSSFVDTLRCSA